MLRTQWIAFLTLVRKEVLRVFRIWPQTLLPQVITTTLYFLIFGAFVGGRIGQVHGASYSEFIAPGLIMMSVITTSYANVSSSVFSAKFQRSIEELLVSPMSRYVMLAGYVGAGIIRGIMVGGLVTAVSLIFSPIRLYHAPLILFTFFLSALLFSLCGFLNAVYAKKFDDISIIPTFFLTPLTYLGGVFYTISFLPPLWRHVSLLNPVLYLVNSFRFGFLGISDIPVFHSLLILSVITSVFLWACMYCVKRGIGFSQ